jgi:hypothetical protein
VIFAALVIVISILSAMWATNHTVPSKGFMNWRAAPQADHIAS